MKGREFGSVVTYNSTYAFLRPESADARFFAYSRQLPDGTIRTGDKVTFDIAPDTYKPGA